MKFSTIRKIAAERKFSLPPSDQNKFFIQSNTLLATFTTVALLILNNAITNERIVTDSEFILDPDYYVIT